MRKPTTWSCRVSGASFVDAFTDTLPGRMNPRFRIMLALAYGASSAVNAGKMYVTQNLLDLNYPADISALR
ncbi:hypothetical protein ACA40_13100 [Pseudomonas syringae pv. lapsa]|nr:hypothetical protein ACA40_13100 [Pseudomonas syringae pv. lapsa]